MSLIRLDPLPGYKPLGGKSRRYQGPGGRTISRRQYDNKRARQAGFSSIRALRDFVDTLQRGRWGDWIYDVKQHTGRVPSADLYHDVEMVRRRRARLRYLYGDQARDDMDPELVAPDGPLARILDASGRRPFNGRAVGDS